MFNVWRPVRLPTEKVLVSTFTGRLFWINRGYCLSGTCGPSRNPWTRLPLSGAEFINEWRRTLPVRPSPGQFLASPCRWQFYSFTAWTGRRQVSDRHRGRERETQRDRIGQVCVPCSSPVGLPLDAKWFWLVSSLWCLCWVSKSSVYPHIQRAQQVRVRRPSLSLTRPVLEPIYLSNFLFKSVSMFKKWLPIPAFYSATGNHYFLGFTPKLPIIFRRFLYAQTAKQPCQAPAHSFIGNCMMMLVNLHL